MRTATLLALALLGLALVPNVATADHQPRHIVIYFGLLFEYCEVNGHEIGQFPIGLPPRPVYCQPQL